MKKFAVGYISFFDNDLVVDIVEAEDIKSAILSHKKLKTDDKDFAEWINNMPDSLEDIQTEFFNSDQGIDVKEIV